MARSVPLTVVLCLVLAPTISAQENVLPRPNLLALHPVGGQPGTNFRVKIAEHLHLDLADRLIFSHPGITATRVDRPADELYPEPRPDPGLFDVHIAPDTPAGRYEVRAGAGPIVSNARCFIVDTAPQMLETEVNNAYETANELAIGTTVNGLFGEDYDYYRFWANAGQSLVVQCYADRIDSRGDPVLAIYDSQHRVLVTSHDVAGRDAVASVSIESDGEFFVRVHDLTFSSGGGASTSPYRLTVIESPWIDYVDPPVVTAGTTTDVTLIGRNLGGSRSRWSRDGIPLEELRVTMEAPTSPQRQTVAGEPRRTLTSAMLDSFVYTFNTKQGVSNPVRVYLSRSRISAASETDDKPTQLTDESATSPHGEWLGTFDVPGDVDLFQWSGEQGNELWIEVRSQRLGQPTDPVLVIQRLEFDDQGNSKTHDIQVIDDIPVDRQANYRLELATTDPGVRFTVPEDGVYRLLLRDQYDVAGTGRPSHYLLRVGSPQTDFSLAVFAGITLSPTFNNNRQLWPDNGLLRRGGAVEYLVIANRLDGYAGPIELNVRGLPKHVTAETSLMGPENMLAAVTVRADIAAVAWTGDIQIEGSVQRDQDVVARTAFPAEVLFPSPNSNTELAANRLNESLQLVVDDQYLVPARIETDQRHLRMSRGGKIKVGATLVPQSDWKGSVLVDVVGLPQSVRKNNVNLATDKSGQIELNLGRDAAPGSYSLFLRGEVELEHVYGKQLEELAKRDVERIQRLLRDYEKAVRDAERQVQQAERSLQQANQVRNGANPPSKQTELARDEAIEAQQLATSKRDAANRARQTADREYQQARNLARPRRIRVPVYSAPMRLEIVSAPARVSLAADSFEATAGAVIEIPVHAEREFEFDDEITFYMTPPTGVTGWQFDQKIKIDAQSSDAVLQLTLGEQVPVGEYDASIVTRMRFNNQTIDERLPVRIVVNAR